MQLTEEQQSVVTQWVAEGASLAEIQERLRTELNISMTYMDTRFLVDDLKLVLADKDEPEPEPEPETPAAPAPGAMPPSGGPAPQPAPTDPTQPPAPAANVSVSIDQITRMDALISGSVSFSDGVSAKWQIDQMGRLALEADQPDYRPSDADVAAFQDELRKLAQSQGL